MDAYVIQLIDAYELDAKLDGAPSSNRSAWHFDIDVSAFGRSLGSSATLYSLLAAAPVGVWVFHEEVV